MRDCWLVLTRLKPLHEAVSARFSSLRHVQDAAFHQRLKILESQARELSVSNAQLAAGVRVCTDKLAARSSIGLADAANMCVALEPLLQSFGGVAAASDMEMRLNMEPLECALPTIGEFIPYPVSATASEIASGTVGAPLADARQLQLLAAMTTLGSRLD